MFLLQFFTKFRHFHLWIYLKSFLKFLPLFFPPIFVICKMKNYHYSFHSYQFYSAYFYEICGFFSYFIEIFSNLINVKHIIVSAYLMFIEALNYFLNNSFFHYNVVLFFIFWLRNYQNLILK